MIKVLHAADLHLGTRFDRLPPEKAASRRRTLRGLLGAMADLAHREGCDLVLLAGDIFDRPEGDGDSVSALLSFTQTVGLPVLIAPGNHDYCDAVSPYLTRQWPENVHIFREPKLEKVTLPRLNCAVWGAGYSSMDCPGLLDGFRATGEEAVQLMCLHGDPIGKDSPSCPVTRQQIADSGLDYLAMGHIHRAGGFQAGDTFCAWPGCPMGRGFDETGRKGVIIAEIEPGVVRSRLAVVTESGYEELTLEVGQDPVRDVLAVLPDNTEDWVYRITLRGTNPNPPTAQVMARLEPHFFHLELKDERAPEADPWEGAGKDTLEGAYFRLLQESYAQADSEDREILDLAAKISRAILEGREVTLP